MIIILKGLLTALPLVKLFIVFLQMLLGKVPLHGNSIVMYLNQISMTHREAQQKKEYTQVLWEVQLILSCAGLQA